MINTTEKDSNYQDLDKMSVLELLTNINKEDTTVPLAVEKSIPQIERLVKIAVEKMQSGGRLFYIGAGTSGRLGVLDASECPPTYGVPFDWVIGLIAGGDVAIRKAVEFAEDDMEQAWKDLEEFAINSNDVVIGIAASGTTPYVIATEAQVPVEVIVGPEFVTGSTRMKAGTAQKLVLNMISTSVMIQLGRVKGNKMVDMQLSNHKLVGRGVRMVMAETGVDEETATALIEEFGNVRKAIENHQHLTKH
jgi:N-acetylmuramic acid 6-phosphate etherase